MLCKRIPAQQPINDFATRLDDLAWNPDEEGDEGAELHPPHLFQFCAVALVRSTGARRHQRATRALNLHVSAVMTA
jgi:hypothetical protein